MPDGFSGPKLGAQFAQLVKELRSEYAGAVTACAQRIAGGVFGMAGRSILRALQIHGVSGTPAIMQQQVGNSSFGHGQGALFNVVPQSWSKRILPEYMYVWYFWIALHLSIGL